jgi:hypothetical protein
MNRVPKRKERTPLRLEFARHAIVILLVAISRYSGKRRDWRDIQKYKVARSPLDDEWICVYPWLIYSRKDSAHITRAVRLDGHNFVAGELLANEPGGFSRS